MLIGTAIAAAMLLIPQVNRIIERFWRAIARLARSWPATLATVFCVSLVLNVVPSVIWSAPVPAVHDEFAYLLSGDTFAHGRLTNPAHPEIARSLESFHTIQTPTYASKFPVGQGMALAIGFLIGLPISGIWLSISAACAAVTWALAAFAPRPWALLGGVLTAFLPLVNWWAQSYWGGGVAMLGGAIFIGAAARAVFRTPRILHGVLAGIGLTILANSRPLEGMLLALLISAWAIFRLRKTQRLSPAIRRAVLPAVITLIPCFAFMGYYNWRVTGDALTMPYTLHAKQYMRAPLLWGQSPATGKTYSNPTFQRFYDSGEWNEYSRQVPARGRLSAVVEKWETLANYITVTPLICMALLAALILPRPHKTPSPMMPLIICWMLPAAQMCITPWLRVTYFAPLVCLLITLAIIGLRTMSRLRVGDFPLGRWLVRVSIIGQLIAAITWMPHLNQRAHYLGAVQREKLLEDLSSLPRQHLIMVKYGPNHDPLFDYVFNGADIDSAKVVFARSIDPETDAKLIAYFRDREVWDIYVDREFRGLAPHVAAPR